MDTQVSVDHQTTDGTSAQLFKSLLDDHATSVFSGKVLVQPHAKSRTSAQQMSRNLLLSKHATAYTRPQLEILADDVRCTHGATVGQLQEEAVFYLRSRGLDEATTRRLLTYANACDALNNIQHPHLHALCDTRVRSELALDAMASTLGETPLNPWTSMSLQHTKTSGQAPKRPSAPVHASGLDVMRIRQDFAGLAQRVNGKPLVYLDNAATAHKPRVVLESLMHAYTADCANIHRGVHTLSARATRAFEGVRQIVKNFIHAEAPEEIVFVRGATEAINLVAASYGRHHVDAGDEIVITTMEHHSNIVPWQMLCAERGAQLKIVPMHEDGTLDMDAYAQLLGKRHQDRGIVACIQCHRHGQSGGRDDQNGARARRSGADRRCPGRASHGHRCAGHRLRLLRFFVAQGVWSHRGRRLVWSPRPCSTTCRPTKAAAI